MRADSCTWRPISLTEDDNSSVADATDWTLAEASSEAAATMVESSCPRPAVAVSEPAEQFQFGRGRRHRFDDLADRHLEPIGELVHLGLALLGGDPVLPDLGLGLLARLLLGDMLEPLHRAGD